MNFSLLLLIFSIVILSVYSSEFNNLIQNNIQHSSDIDTQSRILAESSNIIVEDALLNAATRIGVKRDIKKSTAKTERMKRLLRIIESIKTPELKLNVNSPTHTIDGQAVFAAALGKEYTQSDANSFCGTLRKSGYTGDIVVGIVPDSPVQFINALKKHKAIIYEIDYDCIGQGHGTLCSFKGQTTKVSINMVRYYLYQWWALKYNENALIMLADFRDVFFQSNPFNYRKWEWHPPVAQLTVFQEPYPNKVIYRCVFNGGWVENCYGQEGLRRIGSNTVSCSGVSIGSRDAIVVYSHLITQQIDPRVRYGRNTTKTNGQCISLGMDQGFHNWLVYSGQLDKYMDLKIYQQGEGPVNTVGSFFGQRAILKFSLTDWKVLKGESPNKFFYNWNGDKSPVIHQADRFLDSDLKGGYQQNLAAFQNINN